LGAFEKSLFSTNVYFRLIFYISQECGFFNSSWHC